MPKKRNMEFPIRSFPAIRGAVWTQSECDVREVEVISSTNHYGKEEIREIDTVTGELIRYLIIDRSDS